MLNIVLAIVLGWFAPANQTCSVRPKITGIAHVRIYSAQRDVSEKFYGQTLGLGQAKTGCPKVAQSCYTINAIQQVDLLAHVPGKSNFLAEVGFATDNAEQMRCYLIAHGIKTGELARDADGSRHFELTDPEGQPIAFTQKIPLQKFIPARNQISTRLLHAGFVVRNSAAEDRFYRDLLGFRMYWHGGFKDADTDWEELQVPDGSDWIEYMLNIPASADHKELGVQNHFSLGVSNAKSTVNVLHTRGLKNIDGPEIGRDGKWSADAYDRDGTRVELMEFTPSKAPCCNAYTAPHPKPGI